MKNLVSGIAIALLLGAIYSTPVQAQTYDGVTPAEETVCGELMADGVTKGLYGLCVAYCEAQDTTYEEMDTVSNPDDQILAVYNKRKKETDPPMPCTVPLPSECPCFDQAFVDKIDGFNDVTGETHTGTLCWLSQYGGRTEVFEESGGRGVPLNGATAQASFVLPGEPESMGVQCKGERVVDGQTLFSKRIGITEEQYYACRQVALTAPVCSGG